MSHIFWILIYHIFKLSLIYLAVYVRTNDNNNFHALNNCYMLHTSHIWFLVLRKHLWNWSYHLTLPFQGRRIMGFMWLVQVYPVVRHWAGIQAQTAGLQTLCFFFYRSSTLLLCGITQPQWEDETLRTTRGAIKSYPTFFASKTNRYL